MGTVRRAVVAAMVLAGCSGSGGAESTTPSGVTASAEPGATSSADSITTSSAPSVATDSIPIANVAADDGCLDEPGRLHASIESWYPASSGGSLTLTGDRGTSAALDRFRVAASVALHHVAPAFVASDGLEYQRPGGGCTTHRYAVFTNEDAEIVVSAWRVESAANPFWVPNESEFVALNASTLVSRGSHIAVVLVVGPDGTTARVTAYGARAAALVGGWPSTTTSSPTALPPGLASVSADELIPGAKSMLSYVLDHR